ncbi:MAG: fibronectin type III domain-containing protein [Spirochaetes bacterium]|nr:fibronectin type III domain-containing protein [Spirochaetota bacterium]
MNKHLFTLALSCALMITSMSYAAIDSITMTPAGPSTLSNGSSYYLAGQTYTFHIRATDPLTSVKGDWTEIYVEFREGAAMRESFTITVGPDTFAGNGVELDGSVQDLTGGPYNEIHYAVTVRFLWNCTAYAYGANNIYTRVTNVNGPSDRTDPLNHGVISHVRILNFAQTDEAADGRLNPWHNDFDVTGTVVYASGAEIITNTVPDIASSELYLDGAPAPAVGNNGATAALSFDIDGLYCDTNAVVLGNHAWTVAVAMTNPGGPVTSDNSLTFNCNRIEVEWVRFENGGGVNTPYYLRSINVTGTRIRVRARLENGGGAMTGTTTFEITDNAAGGAHTYTIQIDSGQFEGTALITPMPDAADVPPDVPIGTTVPIEYTVTAVSGGAYGNDNSIPPNSDGQDVAARITGSGPYTLYWDNADAPGSSAPTFTTFVSPPSTTAVSITFNWVPLSTALPVPPSEIYDADFDTYRIYYRTPTGSGPWTMIDRNTVGYAALGTITTATMDVTGLDPLTDYDYRFSAVDVFGNEVLVANQIVGTASTTATSISVTISDGIAQYSNTNFNNRDPAAHPVRDTAIKISVKIITAGNMPDYVAAIIANNDSDVPGSPWLPPPPDPPQYGVTGAANSILDLPVDQRWSINCAKVSPNTYEGFIPDGHPLMKYGTNIRMIIATTVEGTTTWSDHTVETAPPGEYVNDEWRFRVATKAILIPWPTRVLNNVMTAQMPCCYPAYFLTVDSAVTIKVYDAKGRVIATLADRMYRPGGQNIKEMGWCGLNKDNRRVGPGLYYIHIKAVTVGGRVVLDKMMKVVVAH